MIVDQKEYYTAPADDIFKDIKACCIQIRNTYDDQFGYATSKIDRIKDLPNISDNCLSMVGMFDPDNQAKLLILIKDESREWLYKFLDPNNYWW